MSILLLTACGNSYRYLDTETGEIDVLDTGEYIMEEYEDPRVTKPSNVSYGINIGYCPPSMLLATETPAEIHERLSQMITPKQKQVDPEVKTYGLDLAKRVYIPAYSSWVQHQAKRCLQHLNFRPPEEKLEYLFRRFLLEVCDGEGYIDTILELRSEVKDLKTKLEEATHHSNALDNQLNMAMHELDELRQEVS